MNALRKSTVAENETHGLFVVHPLDDVPEIKRSSEGLGLMELTPTVRRSLLALRAYLLAMTLVLVYRSITLGMAFLHGGH